MRIAQKELLSSFESDRVFPIYISFVRGSLLNTSNQENFLSWMLSKISSSIVRSLSKNGIIGRVPSGVSSLAGEHIRSTVSEFRIQRIVDQYENAWKPNSVPVDPTDVPTVDELKDAVEEICSELQIKRFALFFDEAAHIFVPEQQRAFFGLFRDLRSHLITCNAAVYPGVTSFGDIFQPSHDASMLTIDRDIHSDNYVDNMREIVEKQADSTLLANISRNAQNFAILAYASSGNPRILLKTISSAPKMNSLQINETIRDFYRNDIWSEHSLLADKYEGHKSYIDWGRNFVENEVLPIISEKNRTYISSEKSTSAFFWVQRDAPEDVKQALRILSYTGIVSEKGTGRKATRSEIGDRYMVNLGCLFSLEPTPTSTAPEIARHLKSKRMSEFGAGWPSFISLVDIVQSDTSKKGFQLQKQLSKPISVLDLTEWQLTKLLELKYATVGDVLNADEGALLQAYYVGPVRARRMRNAAIASVLEYLSG